MIFVLLVLSFIPTLADAACSGSSPAWTAASANSTIANDDINDCITAASNGDTINVPAGTVTWTKEVTITNKYLTLQGAGAGVTNVTDGATGANNHMLTIHTNASGTTRVTGFSFTNKNNSNAATPTMISFDGTSKLIRVDHNAFTSVSQGSAHIEFFGCTGGVYDHNSTSLALEVFAAYVKNGNGCDGQADDWADSGWAEASPFGTANNIYFEDNTFSSADGVATVVLDSFGGRYVFRFNTITNTRGVTGHGLATGGRIRSMRHAESYGNAFTFSGSDTTNAAVSTTGGTGLAFDNAITGSASNETGTFQYYRDHTTYPIWGRSGDVSIDSITRSGTTATVTIAGGHRLDNSAGTPRARITGATGGDATLYNGTFNATITDSTHFTYTMTGTPSGSATGTLILNSPWDGNTDTHGYPAMDQIGRGVGDRLANTYDVTPSAWPNQALEPWYNWNNTVNGSAKAFSNITPNQVVENRDFYEYSIATGTPQTVGVRVGALADRPAGCTAGVAYWATDQGSWNASASNAYGVQRNGADGVRYDCVSTNTWAVGYTPYTYPHPLQGVVAYDPGSSGTGSITITGGVSIQ